MLFRVSFQESNMQFDVRLDNQSSQFEAEFESLQKITEYNDADPYTGEYEVTPRVEAQTLPTAQKLMTSDLEIKAIPMFDVSNNSGGQTIYIGTEVDIYGD